MRGGPLCKVKCAQCVITPMDLYVWIAEAINESSQTDQETSTCRGSITIHREFSLKDYERNLLSTLPNSVLDEIVENFDVQDVNSDEEDFLPDLNPIQAQFQHLLIDDQVKLLDNILEDLQAYDDKKWKKHTVGYLYPDILRSGHQLMSKCTKEELKIIANIIHAYTGHQFFNTSLNKATNANMIVKAFEGGNFVNETSRKKKKNIPHQPLTLLKCAQNCIMHESYPFLVLKVAYAKLRYLISYSDWLNNATVNMSTCIPRKLAGKSNVYIDLFCYPEYNVLHGQIEPHTLDYSHIITNVRSHISRHGYDYCKKEHFLQLCQE